MPEVYLVLFQKLWEAKFYKSKLSVCMSVVYCVYGVFAHTCGYVCPYTHSTG